MTGRRQTRVVPTPDRRVLLHYTCVDRSRTYTTPDAAALIAFEAGRPDRHIPQYPNQKNTPGLYWSATNRRLLPYESYLESIWMTLLGPRADTTCANTVFTECHVACSSVNTPAASSGAFVTSQWPFASSQIGFGIVIWGGPDQVPFRL